MYLGTDTDILYKEYTATDAGTDISSRPNKYTNVFRYFNVYVVKGCLGLLPYQC